MLTVYKESMRRIMRGKRKFQVPVLKNQIASLAHQTASWYDQVFIQMKRLLEANEENGGEMRWECEKQHSNPFTERILFVIALYNAHEYIENLNAALKQNNDFCFDEIAQRVVEKSRFQQIKDLRNMNVHHCEYLVGSGDKQACFEGIIQDGTYNIHTNAHWYVSVKPSSDLQ